MTVLAFEVATSGPRLDVVEEVNRQQRVAEGLLAEREIGERDGELGVDADVAPACFVQQDVADAEVVDLVGEQRRAAGVVEREAVGELIGADDVGRGEHVLPGDAVRRPGEVGFEHQRAVGKGAGDGAEFRFDAGGQQEAAAQFGQFGEAERRCVDLLRARGAGGRRGAQQEGQSGGYGSRHGGGSAIGVIW